MSHVWMAYLGRGPLYPASPHPLSPSGKTNPLSQQTRDVNPVLAECWASVADAVPTFNQHRVDVSCLQGSQRYVDSMLGQCWACSVDGRSSLIQHWGNIGLVHAERDV